MHARVCVARAMVTWDLIRYWCMHGSCSSDKLYYLAEDIQIKDVVSVAVETNKQKKNGACLYQKKKRSISYSMHASKHYIGLPTSLLPDTYEELSWRMYSHACLRGFHRMQVQVSQVPVMIKTKWRRQRPCPRVSDGVHATNEMARRMHVWKYSYKW